jgi:hypothetical protein
LFLALIGWYKLNWIDLEVTVVGVPSLSPRFISLFEEKIPDADVVIATSWQTAYCVRMLKKSKGVKFYFVQHYEIWEVWSDDESWRLAETIEKDSTKQSLAIAEMIPRNYALRSIKELVDGTYKLTLEKIVVSSWLKEILETRLGVKVAGIVTNGVDSETFDCVKKRKRKVKRVLMCYRKEMKWKGGEDGINALRRVREEFPETEFVMYGSRDKHVPRWVRFYENISDKELAELYCSSDIFVFPSWVEGFGLPPMEAASCKCAVVTTDCGGMSDYTISGKTALVSPPRDPLTLAKNIIYLLKNENIRRDISNAGYKYVRRFTWEVAGARLERILRSRLGPIERQKG